MDLKWSLLKAYPNGSKNIYHSNRTKGRIVVHLEPRQKLEQYLAIHGRLPNWNGPKLNPVKITAHKKALEKKRAAVPKVSNYFLNNIRRRLIKLYKPWAMNKASLNSIRTHTGPNKNLKTTNITIRKKNAKLFTNALTELGWQRVSGNNSLSQFHRTFKIKNGSGTYGFFIILRGSNTNNFMTRTRINNKVPVINV